MSERKKKTTLMIEHLRSLFPKPKTALNYYSPFEFLVAVMLSAQNTDKGVNKVTESLFQKYRTVNDYAKSDLKELDSDIKSINYHTTKAKNIIKTAQIIKEKYDGKVPDTIEALLELPGVGRKTANVILGNLHKKPVGIAVDTHVKRLSQLYGLTKETQPEKIERDLMQIIPKEDWTDFTHLMIEYGRQYCSARKHQHENCPLNKKIRQ